MLPSMVMRRVVMQRCSAARLFSADAKPPSDTGKEKQVEYYKPQYATKATFERTKDDHRFVSAGAESGILPTSFQRRCLVWTRIYKNKADIPEYVSGSTMNRMHDRMRVLFILVGCIAFFSIFYVFERVNYNRIARDRESGKVVTKME